MLLVDLIVAVGVPVWIGVEEVLRHTKEREGRKESGARDMQPEPREVLPRSA
ncbi:MAG TPA: hypothetical protein VEA38_00500 [Terriglobales bacterium]|nr:hypothetical protein [Terriglobales bacterium]